MMNFASLPSASFETMGSKWLSTIGLLLAYRLVSSQMLSGFRNGSSCLIEAKASRADFLADRKKRFRIRPEMGMGDWRFFICEPGIISVEELPEGWGLLHAKGSRVHKVHGWPGNTAWYSHKPFQANKQAECDFMYSALRRMQIRGYLPEVYDVTPKPSVQPE
jgi:hypothetical protein